MSSRLLGPTWIIFFLVSWLELFTVMAVKATPKSFIAARVFKVTTQAGPASAFVLGPAENGSCVLLTAHHVIRINATNEPIFFQSALGSRFTLSTNAFFSDVSLDLAFVPLRSCKYSLALPLARASSIVPSRKVEVIGYPMDLAHMNESKAIPHNVRGRITQFNSVQGYDIYYDADTKPGYSGGPVISVSGDEVLALHGMSDIASNIQDPSNRERLRLGGGGVSSALIYLFLKSHNYILPRGKVEPCLVGVC